MQQVPVASVNGWSYNSRKCDAAMSAEFVVHPNRSQIGPDTAGQNGHFRSVSRPRRPVSVSVCLARVQLPTALAEHGDPDGSLTFGGMNWRFVVGAARTFARAHTDLEVVPPPFGFKRDGLWWWWDDTTSEESILEGAEAAGYVTEYLELLFPGMPITVTDNRHPVSR